MVGALGMDLFEGVLHESGRRETPTFWMLTTIEELLEMIAVGVFVYALAAYARSHCERLGIIFAGSENDPAG